MLVKMKAMEKEKTSMQEKYRLLEEELDTRRRELLILKRDDRAQYMMAERENWRAMMAQQKQVNAKLEKGAALFVGFSVDLEISRERIKSLQQQLEESQTVKVVEDEEGVGASHGAPLEEPLKEPLKEPLESLKESQEGSIPRDPSPAIMGPPQPVTPPAVVEGIEDAYQQLLSKSTELEEELRRYQEGMKEAKRELEEAKQMNV